MPAARILTAAALFAAAAGCERSQSGPPAPANAAAPAPTAAVSAAASAVPVAASWNLLSSGEGSALVLGPANAPALRLFCPAGGRQLLVNMPAARPIGSEERLSFGSGRTSVTLVADTQGDAARGGVSGTGELPANLPALLTGQLTASYGNQVSGPHPAPPADLVRGFAAACRDKAQAASAPQVAPTSAGACMAQESRRLDVTPLRAVGTEPFWTARIDGRCVTYSHPEDQKGTRVWTRYTAGAGGGGTWSGMLAGQPFELVLSPRPGCSDGMSDRRYPLAASLRVAGERRSGCAAPL
ncbi:MAG TPA: hypothetical protein VEZ70_10740 [Allosphingosinicella sp.]|nr:hypothetical protein [Allosphingosinicella sp.]